VARFNPVCYGIFGWEDRERGLGDRVVALGVGEMPGGVFVALCVELQRVCKALDGELIYEIVLLFLREERD